jgi:hypothetical protein
LNPPPTSPLPLLPWSSCLAAAAVAAAMARGSSLRGLEVSSAAASWRVEQSCRPCWLWICWMRFQADNIALPQ